MKYNESVRVLVVIATLGQRPDYLKKTLESIIAQEYDNLELVFVYPADNTATKKLAREYNARSINDPGGISAAVNAGITSASKDVTYVTWIGDDDLLEPGAITASIDRLEANPRAVASYGSCNYINYNGDLIFTNRLGRIAPLLIAWGPNFIPLPGSVFRLSALQKLDYIFDETLKFTMDLDLFLRLHKKGPLIYINQVVSSFRWHPSSSTVSGRTKSLAEAEQVKRRYYPKLLKIFAPIWEIPVRYITSFTARRISRLAQSNP